MNAKKSIIYDWDGTLCDSIPNAFRGTCGIFEKCGVPRPTFEEYVNHFTPPFINFYRERGVSADLIEEAQIWEHYHAIAKHYDNDFFPDVLPTLTSQRALGYTISIVSSQCYPVIRTLFNKHGCHNLFDFVFSDAKPDKVDSFKEACKFMKVHPASVEAIGDFASDMRQAQTAGVVPVGIVRYEDMSEVLMKAGARRVIRSLKELL